MFRTHIQSLLLLLSLVLYTPVQAQFGTILYEDPFDEPSELWQSISIENGTGSFSVSDGNMNITAANGTAFGAYYNTAFGGHFEVEVSFEKDHGIAIALLKNINDAPSTEDYSMLTVMTNEAGHPEIRLTDQQDGIKDVFDNTSRVDKDKYMHELNGQTYSLPFTETAKKLRIFRHSDQQFLHLYYAVEKEINGETFQDWIELSPSKEWGVPNGQYFVGLFSMDGSVVFDDLKVTEMPLTDQDDTNTGFVITQRPYTWSGFTEQATVVTFGDAFPFAQEDRKFVFWNLTNNIPVWHLDNGALFAHGFAETWGGGVAGCNEPMSDRLLGHTDLEIIEDNSVRKVVKWTYDLVNPDYQYPDFDKGGEQLPGATEYYYIYADGSIIRKVIYTPKLDTDFRNWFEFAELIVIAGENQRPRQLYETPSLTFHELGNTPQLHNNMGQSTYENGSVRLGATALTAHVVGAPELFYAFSDDISTPETFTNLPISYEVTWHNRNHNFGHWPVNKEPYLADDACKNWSEWPQHVSHASFAGVSVRGDQSWENVFLEREDGRKFREVLQFMGMNARGSSTTVEDKTNSWLFPGEVTMSNDSAVFLNYSHQDRFFEFETTKELPATYFEVTPKSRLVNPILHIKNWGTHDVYVNMNGQPLERSDYVTSMDENGALLLLITGTYQGTVEFQISSKPTIANVVLNITQSKDIMMYPNPPHEGFINIQMNQTGTTSYTVFTESGKAIKNGQFISDHFQLSTKNLTSGAYLIRIEQGGKATTHRLLIR